MNDIDQLAAVRSLLLRLLDRHADAPNRVQFDEAALHDVLFSLVVINSRFSRLSSETRALAPEVPFDKVRGMRNIVVHEPDVLQHLFVAALVRIHLPKLVADLDLVVSRLEASNTPG